MSDVIQRVREAIAAAQARGLSQSEIERRMQVSRGYLARLLAREGSPTVDSIMVFARTAEVRVEWLLEGRGPMRQQEVSEADSPELVAVLSSGRAARWSAETIASVRAFAASSSERMTEEDVEALGRAIEGQRSMMARPVTHDPVEERRRRKKP